MSGIFVTGTDTGVGKTYITAALTYALRKDGIDAIAMKPIATGSDVNKGIFKSLDAVILANTQMQITMSMNLSTLSSLLKRLHHTWQARCLTLA